MNIWNPEAIFIFIMFVIPGFISLKIYKLLVPSDHNENSLLTLLDAITYSCINYGCAGMPIFLLYKHYLNPGDNKIIFHENLGHAIAYVIIFSAVAPVLVSKFRKSEMGKRMFHGAHQEPWDAVFSKKEPYWIRIYLKNGNIVGGDYGGISHTSISSSEKSIYLEKSYVINEDGGLERPKEKTAGVIVLHSEISHLELTYQR